MKNDYQIGDTKISIPPTLLFSTIGVMKDVRKAVTMDAKQPGDLVFVLGKTLPELGGSEWYAMHGFIGNNVPKVDVVRAKKLYTALNKAMEAGLVASCHDCSDGGLGVALAETAFAGGLGLTVDLSKVPCEGIQRNDELLFSESQSRFVVTIPPGAKAAFRQIMKGNACAEVGEVNAEAILKIRGLKRALMVNEDINELKAAWQKPLNF